MRKFLPLIFIILALLTVGTALCKKYSRRKITGQYAFSAGSLFDGTVIIAKDRSVTRLPGTNDAHAVAGRLKFKRGKQRVRILWPDAEFDGHIVSLNLITGVYDYTSTSNTFHTSTAELAAIPMESNILFHAMITRTKKHSMRGVIFFNYGNKEIQKRDYHIAVYPRSGSTSTLKLEKSLPKLGFFNSLLPEYDLVEVFVVSKDYAKLLPDSTTDFPALYVDGTNVFARDWRDKFYQIPKKYP